MTVVDLSSTCVVGTCSVCSGRTVPRCLRRRWCLVCARLSRPGTTVVRQTRPTYTPGPCARHYTRSLGDTSAHPPLHTNTVTLNCYIFYAKRARYRLTDLWVPQFHCTVTEPSYTACYWRRARDWAMYSSVERQSSTLHHHSMDVLSQCSLVPTEKN